MTAKSKLLRMDNVLIVVNDVVARPRSYGAELVGEIAQYEDIYRLCFLRGPEGILIGLAERLSNPAVTDSSGNS